MNWLDETLRSTSLTSIVVDADDDNYSDGKNVTCRDNVELSKYWTNNNNDNTIISRERIYVVAVRERKRLSEPSAKYLRDKAAKSK